MPVRNMIPALVFAILGLSAAGVSADEAPVKPKKPKLEYVYLTVVGAKTDQIAAAAQKRVEAVKGVQSFVWTIARAEAKVIRIVGQAGTLSLVAAFKGAGLTATALQIGQQQMFFEKKLHCGGCVKTVDRALKALKGTKEVSVSKDNLSVTVVYDMKQTTVAKLKKALADAGKPVK